MSKVITVLIVLIAFAFLPKITYAQNISIKCDARFQNYVRSASLPEKTALGQPFDVTVNFNSVADTSFDYYVKATQYGDTIPGGAKLGNVDFRSNKSKLTSSSIKFTMSDINYSRLGIFNVSLLHSEGIGEENVCALGTINFFDQDFSNNTCNISMPTNIQQGRSFSVQVQKNDQPNIEQVLYFYNQSSLDVSKLPLGVTKIVQAINLTPINFFIPGGQVYNSNGLPKNPPGTDEYTVNYPNSGDTRLPGGNYTAIIEARRQIGTTSGDKALGIIPTSLPGNVWLVSYCNYHHFTVTSDGTNDPTDGVPINQPGGGGTIGGGDIKSESCIDRLKKDPKVKCAEGGGKICEGDTSGRGPGIKTAIGCIHTNPVEFVKDIMTWIIGIGGGLAFLMMLLGAFQMLTSAGNPETLAAGRSRLTSAVIGLLFIIFSILLMQIIGFDILKLPEFGR